MKIAAFDLEIAIALPEGCKDWGAHRPFGISCAAIRIHVGGTALTLTWKGEEGPDGIFAKAMSVEECRELAVSLEGLYRQGFYIVTWNGLKFDFDVLREECNGEEWRDVCEEVALHHIDIGFQMLCQRGFMCGLDVAAKSQGLAGKTEGMRGDLAPLLWSGFDDERPEAQKAIDALGIVPGSRDAQDLVLKYVSQDVKTTLDLYLAVVEQGYLQWTTRAGKESTWVPTFLGNFVSGGRRLLTVREAMLIPLPDTGWMASPRPREDSYAWLRAVE